MGGKHKQAQRTKNNARVSKHISTCYSSLINCFEQPSSSGRSAEMLGTSMPQFVGFSTVKETGFVLPGFSLPGAETSDSALDANFQLVLKKMNKKDSTTKLKVYSPQLLSILRRLIILLLGSTRICRSCEKLRI